MRALILFAAALAVLVGAAAAAMPSLNPESYPFMQANLQRNGLSGSTTTGALHNISVAWAFVDPDAGEVLNTPVYSSDDGVAYTLSDSSWIYAVNASNGAMKWQACLGHGPKFPGEPCLAGFSSSQDTPYSQLSLMSDGHLLIMRPMDSSDQLPEALLSVDKSSGKQRWSYALPEYTSFLSAAAPFPHAGGDAVLVWVGNTDNITYTVLNGTTGAVVTANVFASSELDTQAASFALDPADGTVLSQWTHVSGDSCGDDYPAFMACTGLGKFDLMSGALVWNQSIEAYWTNGEVAVDPARSAVYVTTNQLDAYAYNVATGAPLWKADDVVTSTDDMGWASVCADGTVVFVDSSGVVLGYNPTPERQMRPLWGYAGCYPYMSRGVTTLQDNSLVFYEENSVIFLDCATGKPLGTMSFGGQDESVGGAIAVGDVAFYANVFYGRRHAGALVKLVEHAA